MEKIKFAGAIKEGTLDATAQHKNTKLPEGEHKVHVERTALKEFDGRLTAMIVMQTDDGTEVMSWITVAEDDAVQEKGLGILGHAFKCFGCEIPEELGEEELTVLNNKIGIVKTFWNEKGKSPGNRVRIFSPQNAQPAPSSKKNNSAPQNNPDDWAEDFD